MPARRCCATWRSSPWHAAADASSGEPAAAQATLNKLTLVGYPRDEALRLIALVLAHEIDAMLREDRPFDLAGYERLLRALPELPGEET